MSAKPKSTPEEQPRPDANFWRTTSTEDLIAEQGVGPITDFDALLALGDDTWDDADFEAFLIALRHWRREGVWEIPPE